MDCIDELYRIIKEDEIGGEEVANWFTFFHGDQLVTDEFIEYVLNEHYGYDREEWLKEVVVVKKT